MSFATGFAFTFLSTTCSVRPCTTPFTCAVAAPPLHGGKYFVMRRHATSLFIQQHKTYVLDLPLRAYAWSGSDLRVCVCACACVCVRVRACPHAEMTCALWSAGYRIQRPATDSESTPQATLPPVVMVALSVLGRKASGDAWQQRRHRAPDHDAVCTLNLLTARSPSRTPVHPRTLVPVHPRTRTLVPVHPRPQ
jgi:hypothetical protein